jgi:hypothetical protein
MININRNASYFKSYNIAYIRTSSPDSHYLSSVIRSNPIAHNSNKSRPSHALEYSIEYLKKVKERKMEVCKTN